MKKTLLFTLISFYSLISLSQEIIPLNLKKRIEIKSFQYLIDSTLSFEKVQNNKSFQKYKKPLRSSIRTIWIKFNVKNSSIYDKEFVMRINPSIDNIIYYYDYKKNKWITKREGLNFHNRKQYPGDFHVLLQGNQTHTFYAILNLDKLKTKKVIHPPQIFVENASVFNDLAQEKLVIASLSIAVLLFFFLYSIVLFFNLKERIYLFYCLILLGGILLVCANNKFFNVLIDSNFVVFGQVENGLVYHFNTNSLINKISLMLLIVGFVQLTRDFLSTKISFPKLDKILKFCLFFFLILNTLVSILAITEIQFVNQTSSNILNLNVIIISLLIFYISIKSYRLGYKPALFFLLANLLPILAIIIFSFLLFLNPFATAQYNIGINFSTLSMALTLSIALAGRFNMVKNELTEKKLEALTLQTENEKVQLRNENLQLVEKTNKELKRQHLLNQKIFSTISHDFRGPILSLQYVLNSFSKNKDKDQIEAYFQNLNYELNTSTEMLSNLLNWAKTEINLDTFKVNESKVKNVCEATLQEFKHKLEGKNITNNLNLSDNDILFLPPDILRIAFRNLISNAIKFSYDNSEIKVHFEDGKLRVRDFGKGMNQEKANSLFVSEVDTDLGTKNEEGFGMGLYIVSELLLKYQHKIEVSSGIDEGSEFVISKFFTENSQFESEI